MKYWFLVVVVLLNCVPPPQAVSRFFIGEDSNLENCTKRAEFIGEWIHPDTGYYKGQKTPYIKYLKLSQDSFEYKNMYPQGVQIQSREESWPKAGSWCMDSSGQIVFLSTNKSTGDDLIYYHSIKYLSDSTISFVEKIYTKKQ